MIDEAATVTSERDALTLENDRLEAELLNVTNERDTAQTALTTANTRNTELEAEVAELGKKPGASHVRSTGDDADADEDDVESILDSLSHNKRADQILG